MKILFSSYTFAPNVGGIESISALLADKFAKAGHEIALITETPAAGKPEHRISNIKHETRYRVVRRPSLWNLLRLLTWSDLLFQNNISLRSLIPALLRKKPVIVVHQTWLRNTNGGIGWTNRLKRALLPRATNIAISHSILEHINIPAHTIGNPYDESVFRLLSHAPRDQTLVFLGRLVSDKGVDLLLQSMKILQEDGLKPDLTIIGKGPEEGKLRRLTRDSGLDGQVTFAGEQSGEKLAELLNRHRILVVPSRWAEPFGIVALEGIACGCVVVGSSNGGLREAIGPCGLTFQNGDTRALAICLKELLLDPQTIANLRKEASVHLAKFRADAVASAYLEVIQEICPAHDSALASHR